MAKYSTLSCLFDGSNEYVNMGDVLGFDRTDSFSVSCWVKHASYNGGYLVSKLAASPFPGWAFYLYETGVLRAFVCNDITTNLVRVDTVSTGWGGSWTHAVMTYDGSSTAAGLKIYANGVSQTLTVVDDTLSLSTLSSSSLNIAGRTNGATLINAYIDDVSIYDKELSPAEVTWIYNSGLPRDLAGGGAPSNLVGWWRMGDGDTYPTLLDNSVNSNNGTMTNMESGDIVSDTPGGVAAGIIPLDYPAVISSGCSLTEGAISPLRTPRWVEVKVYTMRGWDPTTSSWKFWTSQFRPTRSPYSNPLAYPQIVKVSTIEVEM